MADAVELIKTIKKAAVQAMKAEKSVEICFGKVTNVFPLKIIVDQKMILGKPQLVLARSVTDFTTEVTVDWITESTSGESENYSFASHNHAVSGRKKITVHNGLVVGDEVILFRQQGGQKYVVADRIG